MFSINADQLKPIFLFSTPRGASNIVSAFLHNHDNMIVVTHNTTKRFVDESIEGKDVVFDESEFVYAESPPEKDSSKLKYVVLHNTHYHKQKKFLYVDYGVRKIHEGRAGGIALIRHPVSVFLSMDAFGSKHNRPGWQLSYHTALRTMQRFILPVLQLQRDPAIYPLEAGSFIKNIDAQYKALCDFFSLDYIPRYGSFQETFSQLRTMDGHKYEVRECSAYSGSFLESKNYKPEPELMFCNPATGKPLLGRGGFNPCAPVSHSRLTSFKHRLPPRAEKILEKVFRCFMSLEDARWLLENEELSVERLKQIDIKKQPVRTLYLESLAKASKLQRRLSPGKA